MGVRPNAPLAPDLLVLPGDAGARLIGVPGGGAAFVADKIGSVAIYPELDIEALAALDPSARSAAVARRAPHRVIAFGTDPTAAGHYANGTSAVCGGLQSLHSLLTEMGIHSLALGREMAVPLEAGWGDARYSADQALADEALLARVICERDDDCAMRHAFFLHLGEACWIWHYNYDTAAIVPPRPIRAER